MQINTKNLDGANIEASAQITNEQIKSSLQNLAKKASKNMKIDGFRQGHVPVNVVLKRYEKELTSDAEQEALKEIFEGAVKNADTRREFFSLINSPRETHF